jgi:hypothetical protein
MRFAMRLFVAFCVATVLAQAIILGLAGARGNLKKETLLKTVALINGVDITGDRLQKMLVDAREMPNPTYEDVEAERARQNTELDMRERSIEYKNQMAEEALSSFRAEKADFDRRKDEFYALLDKTAQDTDNESLQEVQRTLEVLSPDMAKEQIKKFLEAGKMDDVVAIFKGMTLDKRKKVGGEFTTAEEIAQLNEILTALRQGEPKTSLVRKARSQGAAVQ